MASRRALGPGSRGALEWSGQDASGALAEAGHYELRLAAERDGVPVGQSQAVPITIYTIGLEAETDSAGRLVVMANHDDDADDGHDDYVVASVEEDDLVVLSVQVEPGIAGQLVVSATDQVLLRMWEPAGTSPWPWLDADGSPPTWPSEGIAGFEFRVEASDAGVATLAASLTTADGTILDPSSIEVRAVAVEVMVDGNDDYRITDPAPGDTDPSDDDHAVRFVRIAWPPPATPVATATPSSRSDARPGRPSAPPPPAPLGCLGATPTGGAPPPDRASPASDPLGAPAPAAPAGRDAGTPSSCAAPEADPLPLPSIRFSKAPAPPALPPPG